MVKVIIERRFDFLFCGISVMIDNDKIIKLGLSDYAAIDLPEGNHRFRVSALGCYHTTTDFDINNNCTINISQRLPLWYYLSFLSLMCLFISLGILGLISSIWGSGLLVLFIIPLLYMSLFKRQRYFKVKMIYK